MRGAQVIPEKAVQAAHSAICEQNFEDCLEWRGKCVKAVEAAAPHVLRGEVEWTVFRASDGPNGSPAENLRYSTKAGAQESINSRYSTPELWEPRHRIVGAWTK